ncbi:hypothetical protein [Arcicella lustrica]|uniref:Uncharacterized protein n=1 Tax=Arcicella lustrica TaxID=2984196 RepID=A0ABU5SHV1_9BACT|nr:hypothetical protein [Arcicella sp. DC25W]MEA5426862.1 hypothetical protein [Arcicella sp. DC25W]
MKFRLVKIEKLSGQKTQVYSIIMNDEDKNLFEHFLEENSPNFRNELTEILSRIKSIANKEGAKEYFFKKAEGKLGDGVEALFDESKRKLRLYCIRYGSVILILGGGGSKNVRALQDDPKLKQENYLLRSISKRLSQAMQDGDMQWNSNYTDFIGTFIFDDNEDF